MPPKVLGKGGSKQSKMLLGLPTAVVSKYHKFIPTDFIKSLFKSWSKFQISRPKNVRVKAKSLSNERWGSGLDEMYATRLLIKNPSNFANKELELLYHLRVRTSDLVYVTKDGSSISGHPGALKDHTGRKVNGSITEEHGTRDSSREAAIEAENNDSNKVNIKARLATVKFLMSPGESFIDSSLSKSLSKRNKPIYHNDRAIGNLVNISERKLLAPKIQAVREAIKWTVAEDLLKYPKFAHLVHKDYKMYLKPGKSSEQARIAYENDLKASPSKRQGRNRSIKSETDDLDESLEKIAKNNKRPLSPPRSAEQIG